LARGPIGGPIGGPAGQKTSATLILTNFALPRHRIGNETVRFALSGAGPRIEATIRRIDREHANPKRRWEQLGHPEYPNAEILTELHAVSCVKKEVQRIEYNDGIARLEVAMPPQSVASIEFAY
jgi:xylan 1,4-beta-xylosidase